MGGSGPGSEQSSAAQSKPLARSQSRPQHDRGEEVEHATRLLAALNRLRLDDNTCDLELYSGECVEPGAGVRAHRNVLAAATPYFHAMFSSGRWTRGSGSGVAKTRQRLVLQGICKSTLEALVDFIYSGLITLSRDNVQDILISADMIELS